MTWAGNKFLAALGLAGALALGGCAYDDGYGYGGVSVGTGYYGGGGYYDDYYGYGPSAYGGWYDGYYYPGSGYYVYDRGGSRRRWDDGQRRYWESRRPAWRVDQRGRPGNGNDGRDRGQWRNGDRGQWQGDRGQSRGDGRGDRGQWQRGDRSGQAQPEPRANPNPWAGRERRGDAPAVQGGGRAAPAWRRGRAD